MTRNLIYDRFIILKWTPHSEEISYADSHVFAPTECRLYHRSEHFDFIKMRYVFIFTSVLSPTFSYSLESQMQITQPRFQACRFRNAIKIRMCFLLRAKKYDFLYTKSFRRRDPNILPNNDDSRTCVCHFAENALI